jgi:hypothetical protein
MPTIRKCELPDRALLRRYLDRGAYVDCHVTEIACAATQAEYVEAFYTTGVFKLERLLLRWFASRPSTDEDARQLASGMRDAFAAWSVEAREVDQLLLCDMVGRTRSWLMVAPTHGAGGGTRLYFGSAVVPVAAVAGSGKPRLGSAYRLLLGFHKLYSRVLLRAARARLLRQKFVVA